MKASQHPGELLREDGSVPLGLQVKEAAERLNMRRANIGDVSAIGDLTRAAYAKWVPVIGREPMPMVADYDHAVRHHLVDLLHVGGELAALIEMIPGDEHLLIENVAFLRPFRDTALGNG